MRLKVAKVGKGVALGVGGVFFRAEHPERLAQWYQEHLGLDVQDWGGTSGASFSPATMPASAFTVWGAFPEDTAYFGDPRQGFMVNLVVDDLDAALANVEEGGAKVIPEREDHDYGRFGWFVDPAGQRVELWEPPRTLPEDEI